MDGLLIAEQLRALAPLIPAERLAWRFPDDRTAVLPLAAGGALWLGSRPPHPYLSFRPDFPPPGRPLTPFQQQLAARAAGPLESVRQSALDRVVRLEFGPAPGFVPTPGVTLVAELTGRNANLLLLEGTSVVGVERQVLADRNRYRELRVGVAYRPPPPYQKVDPLAAGPDELGAALASVSVERIGRTVDGVGPELAAALRAGLLARGVGSSAVLEGGALAAAVAELGELAARPTDYLRRWGGAPGPLEVARDERLARRRERLGSLLGKELDLARRRREDAADALAAGGAATTLRAEADLLLARADEVPAGAERVTLAGWAGEPVELALDPRKTAAANAQARYDQARRRQARAERAARLGPELDEAVAGAEAALAELPDLSDAEVAERLAVRERETKRGLQRARAPGIRFTGPHGLEVVVGRNARDNDAVTFGVAKSRDLWLHAQGYRGSHVIVRSGGREVPWETVLFAARLAAGHSEARREARVAVDYTERKNVWRHRGGAPGAVDFAHHKTVVVAPARGDEAAGEGEDLPER